MVIIEFSHLIRGTLQQSVNVFEAAESSAADPAAALVARAEYPAKL